MGGRGGGGGTGPGSPHPSEGPHSRPFLHPLVEGDISAGVFLPTKEEKQKINGRGTQMPLKSQEYS